MEKYKSQDFKSKHSVKYTDEFKHMVCKAYLEGNKTRTGIWQEYIGSESEHGNLKRWLKKLGYLSAENIAIASIAPMSKKEPQNQRPHMSNGNLTPNFTHQHQFKTQRLWKNYYFSNRSSVKLLQDEELNVNLLQD